MYIYQVSKGNPEGTDWTCTYTHEKKFSEDEFTEIVEGFYVEVIKANQELNNQLQKEEGEDCSISLAGCMDGSYPEFKGVPERMLDYGFKALEIEQSHYMEPYWGTGNFKNKELLEMFTKENKREMGNPD